MANVVVVGAQWGDEGKGKIVDWLSERADIVARFQGGHNAGHTLVIDGNVYKLSLLPSGIVRGGKLSVIGNGVVLDPWALLTEIEKLSAQGVEINPDNLIIAENTPLILSINDLLAKANDPNLEIVAPVVGAPIYCAGAAFALGNEELRDAYDAVLAEMKESGEFAEIIEPYGFSAEAAKQVTREQLCAAN